MSLDFYRPGPKMGHVGHVQDMYGTCPGRVQLSIEAAIEKILSGERERRDEFGDRRRWKNMVG